MNPKNKKNTVQGISSRGFTIIELLIVVVVVAILAAIVITAYNGITQRATESSLKADLRNNATRLELSKEELGLYPATPLEAKLISSGSNIASYVNKSYGYCVAAASSNGKLTYSLRSTSKQIEEGSCDVVVSTLAGSGASGYADGKGTQAQFASPSGIAIDASGTLYVSDQGNARIRKITSDGTVSLVAGTGVAGNLNGSTGSAQFNQPSRLTVDPSGSIYVVQAEHLIRKINTNSSSVTTFAGTGSVCNYSRGGYSDGTIATANLDGPSGIAVNSAGTFYVSESSSNRIREVQPGVSVSTFAGSGNINSCNANTGDTGNTDGPRLSAKFNLPIDIVTDTDGIMYTLDYGSKSIRAISKDGIVSTTFANTLPFSVKGFAIDSQRTFYIADAYGITAIKKDGTSSLIAGTTSSLGFTDGIGTAARFNDVRDIVVSPDNTTLFAADRSNNVIRKIRL